MSESVLRLLERRFDVGDDTRSPRRAAMATFAAFVVVGFLPLAPFVYQLLGTGRVSGVFEASAAAMAAAFFVVGAVKARFVQQRWWAERLRTLMLGGAAAVLAYMAGTILDGIGWSHDRIRPSVGGLSHNGRDGRPRFRGLLSGKRPAFVLDSGGEPRRAAYDEGQQR